MASNQIYEEIIYQINTLLKQGQIYPKYMDSIIEGKNDYKISQVYTKKNYTTDWIDTIEDCIISLDNIVRNPRKFIVIEEDIVDISLARSISVESVKHLSQHTNLISSVKKDGTVIPSKILNTSKEESFDIYENRFIYTLLLKIRDFIDRRFTIMKNAMLQSGDLGVSIESEFAIDKNKVNYKMESSASFPFDAVVKRGSSAQPTSMERVAHINSIISDFLASPFSKEMRSCALVRPPILRTNVILKNPDFKKALLLWQFIESNENLEFNIETVTETTELPTSLSDKYRSLIYLNTVLMQSIASSREEGESLTTFEEKQEKTISDEYITKNIDDFVPDDFPHLKLNINEIRSVYQKIATAKTLTVTQVSKMNAAIDRVLRQYKINKAKEDSATQKRLIAQQLEEEALAKKLALREQKDLERIRRQEEARRRLEAKQLEAERLAELRRLVKERKEMERKKKEEEERLAQERKIQEERQREELERQLKIQEEINAVTERYRQIENVALERLNTTKIDFEQSLIAFHEEEKAQEEERRAHEMKMANMISEEIAVKEEGEMLKRLATEHDESALRIEKEKIDTLAKLKQEAEDYWASERELAIKLGVEEKLGVLNIHERAELEKIFNSEKRHLEVLKDMAASYEDGLTVENIEHIKQLMTLARRFRSEEEIEDIIRNYEKERKKKRRERLLRKLKFVKSKKKINKKSKAKTSFMAKEQQINKEGENQTADRFQQLRRGKK